MLPAISITPTDALIPSPNISDTTKGNVKDIIETTKEITTPNIIFVSIKFILPVTDMLY